MADLLSSTAITPPSSEDEKHKFFLAPGERGLSLGRTGSGKTALNIFMIERMEDAPVVIYDTKGEPKFDKLPNSISAESTEDMMAAYESGENDYIIVRPPLHEVVDPAALDERLMYHHMNMFGVPAYVDELYMFHRNGQAGPGLTGLLTRGRSKRQTFLGSSQRPRRISLFNLTESDKYYIFRLRDRKDRQRINDIIDDFDTMQLPAKHHFWFFNQGEDKPLYYPPVPIDNRYDTGYTASLDEAPQNETPMRRHHWI